MAVEDALHCDLQPFDDLSAELSADPSIFPLELGASVALFHAARQQIFELNPTAAFIWRELSDGHSPLAVIATMRAGGADPSSSEQYVKSASDGWLGDGWMIPKAAIELLESKPVEQLNVALGECVLSVSCYGSRLPADVLAPFRHLETTTRLSDVRITVAWVDPFFYVHSDGYWRGRFGTIKLAPVLKACMTELLLRSLPTGYLVHGALLDHGGKRFFLTGPPGVGKSTLTGALLARGFQVLTDDIVRIEAGNVSGVPFAIALKQGSWPILRDRFPQIADLSIFERGDGQDVVYFGTGPTQAPAAAIDYFVVLNRGATRLSLEPLETIQALRVMLDSASSPSKRIAGEDVDALALMLSHATCCTLLYEEADDAAELLHVLAQA